MDEKLAGFAGAALAAALLLYISTTGWFVDLFIPEPEITLERQGAVGTSSSADPAAPLALELSHPIPYDAAVTQGGRTRYHVSQRTSDRLEGGAE